MAESACQELELLVQNPAIRISYQLSKPGPGWFGSQTYSQLGIAKINRNADVRPSDCSGRLSKAVLEQRLPSPDSRSALSPIRLMAS